MPSDELQPQLPPSDITPGLVVPPSLEYREAVRRIEELREKLNAIREELAARVDDTAVVPPVGGS